MKFGPGAKTVLMLGTVVVVVAGLKLASALLVPLIAAIFVSVISAPVVRWLAFRRVPRALAILLAVLLNLSVFAIIGGLVGSSLGEFYAAVPQYQTRLTELSGQTAHWIGQSGLDLDETRIKQAVGEMGVLSLVADVFQSIAALISKTLLVSLLALFMLFETGPWKDKLAYVLHRPTQDLPRFANAAREVQTYLVVKSALSVLTGLLCGGWVAVCGVDFALLWGVLAFLLNYVPTLGMFLATIPPVVVALIQLGPGAALLLLGGYLIINFVLGNFVEPRIMGRALGLSPLVILLSMVFWGWLWGPVGALLAVPLTMVIKIAMANMEDMRWVAVLLGSTEWFTQKRKEWEDPFELERRRSLLPDPPASVQEALDAALAGGALMAPAVPILDLVPGEKGQGLGVAGEESSLEEQVRDEQVRDEQSGVHVGVPTDREWPNATASEPPEELVSDVSKPLGA